jgi:hypothetical protein
VRFYGYSIFQLLIAVVAIGGAVALTVLFLNASGIVVPSLFVSAFRIVLFVVVIIFAIGLVRSAMGGPGPGTPAL